MKLLRNMIDLISIKSMLLTVIDMIDKLQIIQKDSLKAHVVVLVVGLFGDF